MYKYQTKERKEDNRGLKYNEVVIWVFRAFHPIFYFHTNYVLWDFKYSKINEKFVIPLIFFPSPHTHSNINCALSNANLEILE